MKAQAQVYNDLVGLVQTQSEKISQQSRQLTRTIQQGDEPATLLDHFVTFGYTSYLGAITHVVTVEDWSVTKVYRQMLAIINLLIQQAPKERRKQIVATYKATKYLYKKLFANPNLSEESRKVLLENERMFDHIYEIIVESENAVVEEGFTLSKWVI